MSATTTPPASTRELMAVLLSRELRDGEVIVGGGVRSAMPMAAAFLAMRRHAPNATLVLGMGAVNPRPDRIYASAGDPRYAASCEGFVSMDDIFELSEAGKFGVAFYGGLQIDRYGNANLTWVGTGDKRVRGPGVANSTLAVTVGRTILYAEHHEPRVFVERVDYNTLPGHLAEGGRPAGAGAGPQLCVTPLGVFDFPAPSYAMAVRSVHPGVTRSEIDGRTGFALSWSAPLPPASAPPSGDELAELRVIDPDGLLR
jgi:glutaconate CoA-transferase subunit B